MNKYYVAMIIDEDILNELRRCYGGDRIEFIGDPIEITIEELKKMWEAL